MKEKKCSVCNKTKPLNDFYFREKRQEYHCRCKECEKKYQLNYKIKNKIILEEKRKQYYERNKDKKLDYQKQYYKEHKKEKRLYDIQYKEKTKGKRNANEKRLYEEDMIYRFKKMARGCITRSFKRKGYSKNTKTYKILGCDYDFFMKHLLETYKKIYNENYNTSTKVHIDHIIPLSTATTKDEVIKLCHFSNLQLLKATDNLKKSNKLNYNIGG